MKGQSGRISVKRLRPQPASSTRPPAGMCVEEERLEPAQHGRVQLEEERLHRRVAVTGVDAVVVGAQDLGIGHLAR